MSENVTHRAVTAALGMHTPTMAMMLGILRYRLVSKVSVRPPGAVFAKCGPNRIAPMYKSPVRPFLVSLLWLTVLLVSPVAAKPRAGDGGSGMCTAPAGPLQATVCSDTELRGLDAHLRRLEGAAAVTSARKATFAHRAREWQAALEADNSTVQGQAAITSDRETLRETYAERIAFLEETLRQDRAVRRIEQQRRPDGQPRSSLGATIPRPPAMERTCLGNILRECRVTAAGMAIADDGRTRVLWQMQHGFTKADRLRAGIVLLTAVRGGFRLLGWSFEGHAYDAPRLVTGSHGLLLHVRGTAGGTGSANADLLYLLGSQGWQEIETESWLAVLPSRLPVGLASRQAVTYDFSQMMAEARLWHSGDANCCPTGGNVMLDFGIEGQRLVLAEVSIDALARAAQPRVDSCPAERATYRCPASAPIGPNWRFE